MKILSSNNLTLRRSPSLPKLKKSDDSSVSTRTSVFGRFGRRTSSRNSLSDDDDDSASSATTVLFGNLNRRRFFQRSFRINDDDDSSSSFTIATTTTKKSVSFATQLVDEEHETETRSFWEQMDTWYTEDDIQEFKHQVEDEAMELLSSGDPRLDALRRLVGVLYKVQDEKSAASLSSCMLFPLDADMLGLERIVLPKIGRRCVVDGQQNKNNKNHNKEASLRLVAMQSSRIYRRFAHLAGVATALPSVN